MFELPITVARRRFTAKGQEETSDSVEIQTKERSDITEKSFWNDVSSFSNLPSNFWTSAQQTLSAVSSVPSSTKYPSGPLIFENNFPIEMPSRDRTAEFRTTAKSCQMKVQANGPIQANNESNSNVVKHSIQFNQLAKRIGRDLSLTCAKMEKLTELAKRRSLFDDRISEVEELSQMVKQDITGLNKQIALLQDYTKMIGSNNKKDQGRGHTQLVVVGLQSKLASVSKDFQNVLELRTENLKQQKSRREKFSQCRPVPSTLPPSVSTGSMGSVLLQDDARASSSVSLDMNQIEQQRLQQQISLIDEQDAYVQARASTMESIESSISELGQIFRQLSSLILEQGEMITRIDSNVEETSMHVEAAHTELLKYFRNISQNRWLMIKVFGVLAVFFIVFVIFLT